jgi:hypothetical protein
VIFENGYGKNIGIKLKNGNKVRKILMRFGN